MQHASRAFKLTLKGKIFFVIFVVDFVGNFVVVVVVVVVVVSDHKSSNASLF